MGTRSMRFYPTNEVYIHMVDMKAYINPFRLSATRHNKHRQNNKVKVKGLGRKNSYLAGFSIFFFMVL